METPRQIKELELFFISTTKPLITKMKFQIRELRSDIKDFKEKENDIFKDIKDIKQKENDIFEFLKELGKHITNLKSDYFKKLVKKNGETS